MKMMKIVTMILDGVSDQIERVFFKEKIVGIFLPIGGTGGKDH